MLSAFRLKEKNFQAVNLSRSHNLRDVDALLGKLEKNVFSRWRNQFISMKLRYSLVRGLTGHSNIRNLLDCAGFIFRQVHGRADRQQRKNASRSAVVQAGGQVSRGGEDRLWCGFNTIGMLEEEPDLPHPVRMEGLEDFTLTSLFRSRKCDKKIF